MQNPERLSAAFGLAGREEVVQRLPVDLGEVLEVHNVHPPFSGLAPADEGLMPAQEVGNLLLEQPGVLPGLA